MESNCPLDDNKKRVTRKIRQPTNSCKSELQECCVLVSDDNQNDVTKKENQNPSSNNSSRGGSVAESFHSDSENDPLDSDNDDTDSSTKFDPTGCRTYQEACKRCMLLPSTYYLKQLSEGKTRVLMKHRSLGAKHIKTICIPLVTNTTVNELDIEGNCFGCEGLKHVSDLLRETLYLTTLNIANDNLGSGTVKGLFHVLKTNCVLRVLDISGNGLQDTEALHIADMIKINKTLTWFNLSHNSFAENGGKCIGEAIKTNYILEYLDLSWNHIRREGASELAKGLEKNEGLLVLNISWNGFSNDGAQHIGDALKLNQTLMELDLSNNRINVDGIFAFCNGLETNDRLEVLKLNQNPVTTTGALQLLNVIRRNTESAIKSLEIDDVSVTVSFGALYRDIKESKPDFQCHHGKVVHSDDVYAKKNISSDAYHVNPAYILMMYIKENGLRLLDLFSRLDKDGDLAITKQEFKKGLEMIKLPISESQMDTLLTDLDKDNSGDIDYGELMEMQKEHNEKMRSNKMRMSKAVYTRHGGKVDKPVIMTHTGSLNGAPDENGGSLSPRAVESSMADNTSPRQCSESTRIEVTDYGGNDSTVKEIMADPLLGIARRTSRKMSAAEVLSIMRSSPSGNTLTIAQ